MIRTLSIVAVSGLVLAAACFAGAFALGARDFGVHGWGPIWRFDRSDHYSHLWNGPETTRQIPWSGDHTLEFAQGGEIHFTQGAERKMVVTGPADLVKRLSMQGGRLFLAEGPFSPWGGGLKIEVTAPDVDTFKVLGSSNLAIAGYDQDKLEVEIDGDGDVTTTGKAREVDLTIRGAGDVDAGRLAADQAHVRILGSGDATIAPSSAADIDIAGSGDVTLKTNPPRLETNIMGSGDVIHEAPSAAPPATNAAPAGKET
jgi:hypothetical protein